MDANDSEAWIWISFRIPGPKPVYTISPLSPLPSLTDPVILMERRRKIRGQADHPVEWRQRRCQCEWFADLRGNSVVLPGVNRFQLSGIRIEGLGTNVSRAIIWAQTLMEPIMPPTVKVAFISMNRPAT